MLHIVDSSRRYILFLRTSIEHEQCIQLDMFDCLKCVLVHNNRRVPDKFNLLNKVSSEENMWNVIPLQYNALVIDDVLPELIPFWVLIDGANSLRVWAISYDSLTQQEPDCVYDVQQSALMLEDSVEGDEDEDPIYITTDINNDTSVVYKIFDRYNPSKLTKYTRVENSGLYHPVYTKTIGAGSLINGEHILSNSHCTYVTSLSGVAMVFVVTNVTMERYEIKRMNIDYDEHLNKDKVTVSRIPLCNIESMGPDLCCENTHLHVFIEAGSLTVLLFQHDYPHCGISTGVWNLVRAIGIEETSLFELEEHSLQESVTDSDITSMNQTDGDTGSILETGPARCESQCRLTTAVPEKTRRFLMSIKRSSSHQ